MQPARKQSVDPADLQSILERARKGDPQAQTALVETYHGLVVSIVGRFFSEAAAREELAQEVWYRVLKNLHGVQSGAAFPGYVAKTARSVALSELKRLKRFEPLDPDKVKTSGGGDRVVLTSQLVEKALQHLDEAHFTVLVLKLYAGMTFLEIAEGLSIPQGTASTRYYTAIQKLQRAVGLT